MVNRRRFLTGAAALALTAFAPFDLDVLAAYGPEWKTPQDFGAIGDGWVDDKQAFQTAINSGYPVYVPWTPGGYNVSSRLRAIDGTTIEASAKKPMLKLTLQDWLVEIVGCDVSLKGLRADFNHLGAGCGAVLLRSDLAHLERVTLKDFLFSGAGVVIQDMPSATYRIVLLKMADIIAYRCRGPGVSLTRSFAYQYAERINLLYTGSPNPVHKGWYQQGNEGGFFEDIDVTGGYVGPDNTAAHGFHFVACKALWLDNMMTDMMGGGGFVFDGCEYGYAKGLISSMTGTIGISVANSGKMTFAESNVGGRAGMPYAPNHPAIAIINSPGTILDDACRVYQSVGTPVVISGSPGTRNGVLT